MPLPTATHLQPLRGSDTSINPKLIWMAWLTLAIVPGSTTPKRFDQSLPVYGSDLVQAYCGPGIKTIGETRG